MNTCDSLQSVTAKRFTLRDVVQLALDLNGWTQTALGKEVGLDQSAISSMLSERQVSTNPEATRKLCKLAGIDHDAFLEGKPQESSKSYSVPAPKFHVVRDAVNASLENVAELWKARLAEDAERAIERVKNINFMGLDADYDEAEWCRHLDKALKLVKSGEAPRSVGSTEIDRDDEGPKGSR